MKKIITLFDSSGMPAELLPFIRSLNDQGGILLTGIFLPRFSYTDLWSSASPMSGVYLTPLLEGEDDELMQRSIEEFKTLCVRNAIEHRVHDDQPFFSLENLKNETRFADLMIISSEHFFEHTGGDDKRDRMLSALSHAECPVIIVPHLVKLPEQNILAYDGSASSVFAIKQFSYMLPQFAQNETLLVYLNKREGNEFPNEQNIEELCARHFSNLSLLKLEFKPKSFLTTWLGEQKNALLVGGSFGRSELSSLFRKSFIEDVIAEHKVPVFVSHCF